MSFRRLGLVGIVLAMTHAANCAHAGSVVPIDLNDFFADPTVTVTPDGSSADMAEDPLFSQVLLSNDPGLGDPDVIIPGVGVRLTFNYDFVEALGEDDEFGAFVIDAGTGVSAGSEFEFFIDSTESGTKSFKLTSLDGKQLGLQFQLSSLFSDTGFNSTVTVSDVRLDVIPEATSFAFWAVVAAGLGIVAVRFKRQRVGVIAE